MTAVHPLDTPITRVLAQLSGVKARGRDAWIARCPSHEDQTASLSVGVGKDGRVLLNCHAGCTFNAIVAELGTQVSDLFAKGTSPSRPAPTNDYRPPQRPALVKSYDYTDEDGTLLFQACRFEPKTFRQRKPDGKGDWTWKLDDVRLVPYRLPDIIQAIAEERPVYVVEGEKDADLLASEGFAATTCPMGAGKWKDEYSALMQGATVHVLPDNDEPGRTHAEMVAGSLTAHGCTVRVVTLPGLPPKGDVSDWLNAGHTLDELDAIVTKTRLWNPSAVARKRWRLDELWDDEEVMRPPLPIVPRLAWEKRCTLLASREKAGKSTLTGCIIAAVSTGGLFLEERCQRGNVIAFGLEEFIGEPARRLRHYRADATRVYLVDKLPADPVERLKEVREHMEAVKPILIVVDSLIAYGAGRVTDANSSAQMGPLVQEITDLAREFGSAVILIHHAKKADGKYRDSTAIGGAVDVIAEMYQKDREEDTDPTLRHFRVVGRVPSGAFSCRWDGQDYRLDGEREAPVAERIISFVRSHPNVAANEVANRLGGNRKRVMDEITMMLNDGRLGDLGNDRGRKLVVPAVRQAEMLENRPGTA